LNELNSSAQPISLSAKKSIRWATHLSCS
jgi:hypothetical protein